MQLFILGAGLHLWDFIQAKLIYYRMEHPAWAMIVLFTLIQLLVMISPLRKYNKFELLRLWIVPVILVAFIFKVPSSLIHQYIIGGIIINAFTDRFFNQVAIFSSNLEQTHSNQYYLTAQVLLNGLITYCYAVSFKFLSIEEFFVYTTFLLFSNMQLKNMFVAENFKPLELARLFMLMGIELDYRLPGQMEFNANWQFFILYFGTLSIASYIFLCLFKVKLSSKLALD